MQKNMQQPPPSSSPPRPKVILSGATGFLASKIGQVLARQGYDIHALVREPAAWEGRLPYPARLYAWQGEDASFLTALVDGAQAVIHLAGENVLAQRWTPAYRDSILQSRQASSQALVKAIHNAKQKPAVYIQASAVGYYGDQGEQICREDKAPGEDFLAKVCLAWEKPVEALPPEVRPVILRFGLVLGLSGGALARLARVYALGLGALMGKGQQYVSWIHLDDACGLVNEAVHSERFRGVYNAVSPEPVTFATLHSALQEAIGKRSFWRVPAPVLRRIMGEQGALLLASQRASSTRAMGAGYRFLYPELETALASQFSDQRQSGVLWHIRKMWLPQSPHELWSFFRDDPAQASATPPFQTRHLSARSTPSLTAGTTMNYRLWLFGLPLSWRSRIAEWKPEVLFAEEQSQGPFALWYHRHHFYPLADGTLLVDEIQFTLPGGRLAYALFGRRIERALQRTLAFRQAYVAARFGKRA